MDMPLELHTNNGWAMIGAAVISVFGGLLSLAGHIMVKRYVAGAEENGKLKEDAVQAKIEAVKQDLKLEMQRVSSDFQLLKVKIENAVKEAEAESLRQAQRLASAMTAVKNINQQSQRRFDVFQTKLEEMHVLVERIRSGSGK